jgi:hypothetical protein
MRKRRRIMGPGEKRDNDGPLKIEGEGGHAIIVAS